MNILIEVAIQCEEEANPLTFHQETNNDKLK